MGNYPRLEARYLEIDLMECSLRKVLNLTYAWLVGLIGGTEEWEKNYAPIFDPKAAEAHDMVDVSPALAGRPRLILDKHE